MHPSISCFCLAAAWLSSARARQRVQPIFKFCGCRPDTYELTFSTFIDAKFKNQHDPTVESAFRLRNEVHGKAMHARRNVRLYF